jgi:hypothetical protein
MQTTEPVIYSYHFSDLPLKPGSLANLMGYADADPPEPIAGILEGIFAEVPDHTDIRGGMLLVEPSGIRSAGHVIVKSLDFHTGRMIARNLAKSEWIAFFMMTAGRGIEDWSKDAIRSGESLTGYIIDLLGSEVVESAVDCMQADLVRQVEAEGYRITNRYSPGYCGWQLDEQQKLFSLFPDGFCGIRLTGSSLMTPLKSVSGMIGIGREVQKTAHSCQICELRNCIYRDRKGIAQATRSL